MVGRKCRNGTANLIVQELAILTVYRDRTVIDTKVSSPVVRCT
jgi:hypothetical protein